jgi:nucleoside-diphosphate-sugar epimerase
VAAPETDLTVAVTGPTGTFGAGLVPLLQADDRVKRIVGIARRPFDPAERGWTKMEYRRGDVRDPSALREAFAGADVVVHLAFLITGNASRETTWGSTSTARSTSSAPPRPPAPRRFVYASSVAAYGWHPDNPEPIREDWPVRPAARLFYAQEKAELEQLLGAESATTPGLALYLLRPPIVLGPNAVGAKDLLPGPLAPLAAGSSAARAAAGDRPAGHARSCGCRSCTRRTSAGRCSCASSRPVRPAPTTSRGTAC